MKALVSAGVSVSVTDESFYANANARATVPLVVLATHQDKANPAGSGVAQYTTAKEVNKPQLITSSRELLQKFGNPTFQSVNGSPLHGNELNEYGLLAAYRILNQVGRCWVMRADVDLSSLAPRPEPRSSIDNGGYWFDTGVSKFGIFARSDKDWVQRTLHVIVDTSKTTSAGIPLPSVGQDSEYAIVAISQDHAVGAATAENILFEKIGGNWVEVGSPNWNDAQNEIVVSRDYTSETSNIDFNLPVIGEEFKFKVIDKVSNADISVNGEVTHSVRLGATIPFTKVVSGASWQLLPYAETTNSQAFQLSGYHVNLAGSPRVIRSILGSPAFSVGDDFTVTVGTASPINVTMTGTTKEQFVEDFNGAVAATSGGAVAKLDYLGNIVIRSFDQDITLTDLTGTPVANAGLTNAAAVESTGDTIEHVAAAIDYAAAQAGLHSGVEKTYTNIVLENGNAHIELVLGSNRPITNTNNTGALVEMGMEGAATLGGSVAIEMRPSLTNITDQVNGAITTNSWEPTNRKIELGKKYAGTANEVNFVKFTESAERVHFEATSNAARTLGFPEASAAASLVYSDNNAQISQTEGNIWFDTSDVNTDVVVKIYNATAGAFTEIQVPMYASTDAAYDVYFAASSFPNVGSLYADYSTPAHLRLFRHNGLPETEIGFTLASGATFAFNLNGVDVKRSVGADKDSVGAAQEVAEEINNQAALAAQQVVASVSSLGELVIVNRSGRDLVIGAHSVDGNITPLSWGVSDISAVQATHSNWEDLQNFEYISAAVEPSNPPAADTMWYDAALNSNTVDLLRHDGAKWAPITGNITVSASRPILRTNRSPLQQGDIWVSTADLESFPRVHEYKGSPLKWTEIDVTDQSSENGILFGDARANKSSGLDSDAPNPALYPSGMLLWNTRASAYVVKQYKPDHTDGPRWVTVSGKDVKGVANMGRHAQRAIVVRELQESLLKEELRSVESRFFNVILTPGYPECLDEMTTLSVDRKETAFVVGDTPARLLPSGSAIQEWATNANGAEQTGDDGLTLASNNVGIYYPWGLATNVDGSNVMVPPSMIAMSAIIFNDNVSYPWFAPAGFERGQVSGVVTSVGYLDSKEGEFRPVALTEGQRDTLYVNRINPIAEIPGRGLVVYGQKTLSSVSSAMDRINVSRLVVYLRYQFEQLAKPFLFEINDELTRQSVQQTFDRFLGEIVGLRGLYEYAVVCDGTNNTPERIDRNELWIDIAIKPAKAIEFIYIPVRVKNTGDSLT